MKEPELIDDHQTDYQEGNVIMDMTLTKMANGQYKASAMGLESNHHDSDTAVLHLQDQLQEGLKQGTIRPGM